MPLALLLCAVGSCRGVSRSAEPSGASAAPAARIVAPPVAREIAVPTVGAGAGSGVGAPRPGAELPDPDRGAGAAPIAAQVPILMYHYVSDPPAGDDRVRYNLSVPPAAFEEQMTYLRVGGYHPVTLAQLADHLSDGAALPDRPVVLTFDDGYIDHFTNAVPVLRRFGYPATFFVITGFVDAGRAGYMSWDQLAEVVAAGMEIGAHSIEHPDLRGRSIQLQFAEVALPKAAIEQRLGTGVVSFAYPSGRYDATSVDVLRAAGYRAAVTTAPGTWQFAGSPFQLSRVRVPGGGSIADFHAVLERAMGR